MIKQKERKKEKKHTVWQFHTKEDRAAVKKTKKNPK